MNPNGVMIYLADEVDEPPLATAWAAGLGQMTPKVSL
jgi:hypothetical protein